MTVPNAAPAPRGAQSISIEDLTSSQAQRRIVAIGFPKQKALIAALTAAMALAPEDTDEAKTKKEAARKGLLDAVKDNEPCLSLGIDPNTGLVNSQDWAILAGHPDRLGRTVVLGGAYKRLRQGQRGQYVQTVVRTPYPIINGILRILGIAPTQAPRPTYGNPGGTGFAGAYGNQGGMQPAGGMGGGQESSVAEEGTDETAGGEFPL